MLTQIEEFCIVNCTSGADSRRHNTPNFSSAPVPGAASLPFDASPCEKIVIGVAGIARINQGESCRVGGCHLRIG